MNNTYIALTIGPIYKTMKLARRTREFWAASFLFSLLAKTLCEKLQENGVKEDDFLVPHPDIFKRKEMLNIGLYSDRIICKSDSNIWDKIDNEVIGEALKSLSEILCKVESGLTDSVLKSYFKIYAVIKDVDENYHTIEEISDHLNTLELYNIEDSSKDYDYLIKQFLENVNTDYDDNGKKTGNENFLKNFFNQPDFKGNIRIPSIPEISTKSLLNISDESKNKKLNAIFEETLWRKKTDENELFKLLKKDFGNQFKNYNKYICILQADGDNLGRQLMEMKAGEVKEISKTLIDWGKNDAYELIKKYGGLPIYIGGDDVLCFAPVNNGQENILELAGKLNSTFCSRKELQNINSTLSIGIKIVYYKSPMYENYIDAIVLLNEIAKKNQFIGSSKNSCCIALEKHSGQPHQFVFDFKNEYSQFIKPVYDNMNIDDKKKSFITSVFYKIRANENLIKLISNDKDRLWYFFENNFDEAKSGSNNRYSKEYYFLKAVDDFLFYLFSRYGDEKIENQDIYVANNELFSALKTIRFIKGLDYDN